MAGNGSRCHPGAMTSSLPAAGTTRRLKRWPPSGRAPKGAAIMADLLTPLQAKIVAVLARKPMRCAEWNELGREMWPPSQHPRAWRYSSNGGPPGWAMSLSRACRQLQGMGIVFDRHYAKGQRDVKLSASGFAAWNRRTPPAGDAQPV